jgi:hypothetical protein
MGQAAEAMAAVVEGCYTSAVSRAFEAADSSSDPVRSGVEAAVAMAEINPVGARAVLWRLQGDARAWEMMEEILGGKRTQAAMRIGAALQIARAELMSPTPQLKGRLPELMEWLGQRELHLVE